MPVVMSTVLGLVSVTLTPATCPPHSTSGRAALQRPACQTGTPTNVPLSRLMLECAAQFGVSLCLLCLHVCVVGWQAGVPGMVRFRCVVRHVVWCSMCCLVKGHLVCTELWRQFAMPHCLEKGHKEMKLPYKKSN